MKKTEQIIYEALERFKNVSEYEKDFRDAAVSDFDFYTAKQWNETILANRNEDTRPCLVINKLPQFVRQVTNDQRQNRPSIKIIPTKDATQDDAEIYEGMVRYIQNSSSADIAYDTACLNQVICGLGYFRVSTDYLDDTTFEQDIVISRIMNPLSVFFDPAAKAPNKEDARYCFVTSDLPKGEYDELYEARVGECSTDDAFAAVGNKFKEGVPEGLVRVAEYFSVENRAKKVYQLETGEVVDKLMPGQVSVRDRDIIEKKIIWRLISSNAILQESEWVGSNIPIIPVFGDQVEFNGVMSLKGLVRDAKDSQRMYNYWASAATETIALAPKAPFIMAEGQDEGYEAMWKESNVRNFPALKYKPTSINGNLVGAPKRQTSEPPIQAMVQSMRQAGEDLKSITGIHDASLGAQGNETSGKSIMLRQKQGDVANYHFQDNLARAINYCGRILIDLIPKIYDTPRVVRILGLDNKMEERKVKQEFLDQKTGRLKIFDPSIGKYDVITEVGPTYKTKRQEAAEAMTMILQSNPQLWPIAGDLLVKSLDWPNANEIAERLELMLPPELKKDKDGVMSPQAQKMLAEAQEMIKQLSSRVNELEDEKEFEFAKLESKEKIAAMDNETKIIITELKNNFGTFTEELASFREILKKEMTEETQPVDSNKNSDTMGSINTQEPVGNNAGSAV